MNSRKITRLSAWSICRGKKLASSFMIIFMALSVLAAFSVIPAGTVHAAAPTNLTVADGVNPSNAAIGPGGVATDLDGFYLQPNNNNNTITVTAVTVTLGVGSSAYLSRVDITDNSNVVLCSATSVPSDTVSITGCSITVPASGNTTNFKVRVTPKSATAMPAVPGGTGNITGTVTGTTNNASNTSYSDSASATVSIDNQSPADVTNAGAIPGNTQATITWTNPGTDFSGIVVLRSTSLISDVPTEGVTYGIGSTTGASTIRYVGTGASFTDTSLANGTTYYYKIFAYDAYKNYSSPGVQVSVVPAVQIQISGTIYDANGTTTLSGYSGSVKLALGGSSSYSTTSAAGLFSFSVNKPATSTVIAIWLDTNGAAPQGSLVFRYGDSCTGGDCNNLSLIKNSVTIDNRDTGSMTSNDLKICNNNSGSACTDTDIGFMVTSGSGTTTTLTFPVNTLYIATTTFAPGGNVVAQNLSISSGGTYTGASETLTLTGTGTPLSVSGAFNLNSNTVVFGTSSAVTIPGLAYYNLAIAGTATVTSASNITVNNILTIYSGSTFNADNDTITLASSGTPFAAYGTFVASSSSISFNASTGTTTIPDLAYYNLTFNPSTGTPAYQFSIVSEPSWVLATTTDMSIDNMVFDDLNGIIYAASSGGAVYKCPVSSDCALAGSWAEVLDTNHYDGSGSLGFDPVNGVIYFGAGNYPTGEIYRCQGSSGCASASDWTLAATTSEMYINDFAFDSVTNTMYAGTVNSSYTTGSIYKCLISTGCAASGDWTMASTSISGGVSKLAFDSTDGALYIAENSSILRCLASTGCQNPGDWTLATSTSDSVYSLAFDPSSGVMYAGNYSYITRLGQILRCASDCGTASNWAISATLPLANPTSFAFDSANNAAYALMYGYPNSSIYRCISNCGSPSGWNKAALVPATLSALVFDTANNEMYVADSYDHIYRRPALSSPELYVANNLTLNGAGNETVDALTSNMKIIADNLTIGSGDTFLAASATASPLTITGNFTNKGAFAHNNGIVVFASSTSSSLLSGATTFNDFKSTDAGKTIKFASSTVFTFAGTLTLAGTDVSPVSIQSGSNGTQWLAHFNNPQSGTVAYANFKDSGCDAGSASVTLDASSQDKGNNGSCWILVTVVHGGGWASRWGYTVPTERGSGYNGVGNANGKDNKDGDATPTEGTSGATGETATGGTDTQSGGIVVSP